MLSRGFRFGTQARRRLRPLLLVLLFLALLGGCAGGPVPPPMDAPHAGPPSPRAAAIITTARKLVGVRYRAGGCTPQDGFDCSGFIQYVYGRNGLSLPRSSSDQFDAGMAVDSRGLLPGDLVFFRIGYLNKTLHVGVYTGGGYFIHSPSSGGRVREEPIAGPYWPERYAGARRVM